MWFHHFYYFKENMVRYLDEPCGTKLQVCKDSEQKQRGPVLEALSELGCLSRKYPVFFVRFLKNQENVILGTSLDFDENHRAEKKREIIIILTQIITACKVRPTIIQKENKTNWTSIF